MVLKGRRGKKWTVQKISAAGFPELLHFAPVRIVARMFIQPAFGD
jgi:hypothetical protein